MGFLETAFSVPTVLFSALLTLAVFYWGLVAAGALGSDMLDGLGEGALEVADGALESTLGAFGIGKAPVSVWLSTFALGGWATSMVLTPALAPVWSEGWAGWPSVTLTVLAASALGAVTASLALRPLAPLFALRVAPRRRELLGRVGRVTSGKVTDTFGQVEVEDGGAGLVLAVFCPRDNPLRKGDPVLLLDWSAERQAYEIEPLSWLRPEEMSLLDRPRGARRVARSHRVKG